MNPLSFVSIEQTSFIENNSMYSQLYVKPFFATKLLLSFDKFALQHRHDSLVKTGEMRRRSTRQPKNRAAAVIGSSSCRTEMIFYSIRLRDSAREKRYHEKKSGSHQDKNCRDQNQVMGQEKPVQTASPGPACLTRKPTVKPIEKPRQASKAMIIGSQR